MEEAVYMTNHASAVTVLHRRDKFRAEHVLQQRLFNNKKIKVVWNGVLEEILGDKDGSKVGGALIRNVVNNKTNTIEIDGIFIAIGHKPNTTLLQGKLSLDQEGYIVTKPGTTDTEIPGLFAAGDVQDKKYRQAVTAAGTGCMAAIDACKFIEKSE